MSFIGIIAFMKRISPSPLTLCFTIATGIALGAFGAHGLSDLCNENQLDIWEKGVFYQLVNAIGLLALSTSLPQANQRMFAISKTLIFSGIMLFSGTLYLLATRHIVAWPAIPVIGILTPVGGVLMISGWVTLALALRRKQVIP